MSIKLQLPTLKDLRPRLAVIGVGGAGCNAINNMIAAGLTGVDFIVANTDAQALSSSSAEHRIQLGVTLTEGLGAGSRPEIGEAAAEEAIEDLRTQIAGAHMVFIAAGMGGGTGTGAAAVIARTARELGILVVGIVTKPFHFEGTRRMRIADLGVNELKKHVDTLIVIPNQNLFRVANERTTFAEAFLLADQVLYSGVACIVDLIIKEGLINLDFADVRTVMSGMGTAMMGTGEAAGERRAIMAAEEAIANPLLDDVTLRGARGLLLSISGGRNLTLYEVDEAASRVRAEVDPEANIIVGATFDESLGDRVRVSIVASGMLRLAEQGNPYDQPAPAPMFAQAAAPVSAPVQVLAPAQPHFAAPAATSSAAAPPAVPVQHAVPPGRSDDARYHGLNAPQTQGAAFSSAPSVTPPVSPQSAGQPQNAGQQPRAPAPSPDVSEHPRRNSAELDGLEWHGPQIDPHASGSEWGFGPERAPSQPQAGAANGWQAPGNVMIEELPPPAPVIRPRPAAEPVKVQAEPGFTPELPADIRRPARRIPDVDEFPAIAQREYRSKMAPDSAHGHLDAAPGKRPGLFERLAGMGRRADDSPNQVTQQTVSASQPRQPAQQSGRPRTPQSPEKGGQGPVQKNEHPVDYKGTFSRERK